MNIHLHPGVKCSTKYPFFTWIYVGGWLNFIFYLTLFGRLNGGRRLVRLAVMTSDVWCVVWCVVLCTLYVCVCACVCVSLCMCVCVCLCGVYEWCLVWCMVCGVQTHTTQHCSRIPEARTHRFFNRNVYKTKFCWEKICVFLSRSRSMEQITRGARTKNIASTLCQHRDLPDHVTAAINPFAL